jgi:DUF3037 family protein
MATLYSVIRYLPSALSDESVNVGLLFVDGHTVKIRSLQEWDRLKCFAGREWKSVRRLIADIKDAPASVLDINPADNADKLNEKLSHWQRSLRFSEIRGSLEKSDALAQSLSSVFLRQATENRLDINGRRKAIVDNIYAAVQSAYAVRFDRRPTGLLKRDIKAAGRRTQHKVDVGIANGSLYAGAFAISFANVQENRQWRDTDAIAFALEDMTIDKAQTPLAVLLDVPEETSASARARTLFGDFGAELLTTNQIQTWAQKAVMNVPDDVAMA